VTLALDRPAKRAAAWRLSRYVLVQTLRPLSAGLGVILVGLLMERVLRLLELMSGRTGDLDQILQMAMHLVPHYLGLALPAAFFFGLLLVVTRLDSNTELDAMSNAGLSLYEIVRPLIGLGVLFALVSILLFGYLQPYSRYAYRAILHAVTNGEWDGTVTEGVFTDVGNGFTMSADSVDITGTHLKGVFIRQIDGVTETVTTARNAELRASKEANRLVLQLHQGLRLRIEDRKTTDKIAFATLTLDRSFPADAAPFRARGNNDRELTLTELHAGWNNPAVPHDQRTEFRAEFHQRLVRAATLPLLPFLGFAVGKAAKRNRRAFGYLVGGFVLLLYHHIIQLGQSLAETGNISPYVSLWLPAVLFGAFCLWAFERTNSTTEGSPFNAVMRYLEQMIDAGATRFHLKREPA